MLEPMRLEIFWAMPSAKNLCHCAGMTPFPPDSLALVVRASIPMTLKVATVVC
jgi:hypothetical protein